MGDQKIYMALGHGIMTLDPPTSGWEDWENRGDTEEELLDYGG